jgi:hypothetical protein
MPVSQAHFIKLIPSRVKWDDVKRVSRAKVMRRAGNTDLLLGQAGINEMIKMPRPLPSFEHRLESLA